MDKIDKTLRNLCPIEKIWALDIVAKISSGKIVDLDIKKLKGYNNIFRVRKGKLRIIYQINKSGQPLLISIGHRDDHTYHFK